MVFSSLIFLFVFLPLVLLCHFVCPRRARNAVLLVFSFVFYAWGEPRAFFVMLAVIAVNYSLALAIWRASGKPRLRTALLALAVCASFAFLFYFKYFDFATHCIQYVLRHFGIAFPRFFIVLPIGISFYVFQSVSYTIDVYRGGCLPQRNAAKLALYVSFFPQLIAGPIVKYHEIEDQLSNRQITLQGFASGLRRFIFGLSKKTLIANSVARIADNVFPNFMSASTASLWLGAFAYSMQIYFDFSGYSDMALGLARMFGFRFEENFNYPYISRSVAEFWRRWHISLGSWFREYVYIPLGGNRRGKERTLLNVALVFLLTGIWHGAALTFVAWGLWHGFFNIMERLVGLPREAKSVPAKVLRTLYSLCVVFFGWVLFRSLSIRSALNYALKMFALSHKGSSVIYSLAYFATGWDVLVLVLAALLCLPVFPRAKCWLISHAKTDGSRFALSVAANVFCLALLLLCATSLASGTYNPFIYFRF